MYNSISIMIRQIKSSPRQLRYYHMVRLFLFIQLHKYRLYEPVLEGCINMIVTENHNQSIKNWFLRTFDFT